MGARMAVTAILAGTLCAVFYHFQSQNSYTLDNNFVTRAAGTDISSDDNLETSLSNEQAVTTSFPDLSASSVSRSAPVDLARGNQPPVLLPHQVPSTPMAQSLEDLQLPPIAELLETELLFAAERVDPLWAGSMEGYILREIALTNQLQLVTLHVECRTSMCRLQLVEHGSKNAEPRMVFPVVGVGRSASDFRDPSFRDLVSRVGLDARWVASVVDRNGTRTSFAYLARADDVESSRDVAP